MPGKSVFNCFELGVQAIWLTKKIGQLRHIWRNGRITVNQKTVHPTHLFQTYAQATEQDVLVLFYTLNLV